MEKKAEIGVDVLVDSVHQYLLGREALRNNLSELRSEWQGMFSVRRERAREEQCWFCRVLGIEKQVGMFMCVGCARAM